MEFLGRYVADAEELQQETSATVITGRQEDPGEAPWKKSKMELVTKHDSGQNDPSREIQQCRCLSVSAIDPIGASVSFGFCRSSNSCNKRARGTHFFSRWCGAKLQTKLIVTTRR